MKILIAEDEPNISMLYRIALESRGHEVTVAADGEECVRQYRNSTAITHSKDTSESLAAPPFDAVVLDYRMPKMDGMDAAKHILGLSPKQRIIFASAFVKETLMDSIKELDQIVELVQKPFEIDVLVDTVEDKTIYLQLERMNVDIKNLKGWDPTHAQVRDLLDGLLKLRKPEFDFQAVRNSSRNKNTVSHANQSAG